MKKVLLVLRTPPPFGGGELFQQALREHYAGKDGYIIKDMRSTKRGKQDQGKFASWKLLEFVNLWLRTSWTLLTQRPRLLFMGIGKGFPHFVRDSILVLTARTLRVPVALELHGMGFYFLENGGWQKWYGAWVASQAVCVRVLGESIASELRKHEIANTVVLENGVEVPDWAGDSHPTDTRWFNVLFVGTLSADKGFDVLVDASDQLHEVCDNFRIHCMGVWYSSDFEAEMRKRIRQRDLDDHFVFHGLKVGDEKWKVFSECHVLTLPSLMEGQPLVILEAMGFGLAVVATMTGAIPDTIENDKNGFLIPKADSKALFESLLCLRSNDNLRERIGIENRRVFLQRFSLDQVLEKHERWILNCAYGHAPPPGVGCGDRKRPDRETSTELL